MLSDWLVVCDCGFSLSGLWCPLAVPTILLVFHLPWTLGLSSRLLQQSTATDPYLWCRVAPLGCASVMAHMCGNFDGTEAWKAEDGIIDAFELWCWRRLLRVSWTARRSNILKEISPECSLEELGEFWALLETKAPILWLADGNWLTRKDPYVGKDWRREEKGMTEDEMVGGHHWLIGHEFE